MRLVANFSIAAFALTWTYFGFVVWMSSHPSIEEYVYHRLRIDTFVVMLILSIIGVVTGTYASLRVHRYWKIAAGANLVSLLLILVAPRAVL